MKTYFVYSSQFEDILREEGCCLMVNYAKATNADPYHLPGGFPDMMADSGGFQLQTGTGTSRHIHPYPYSIWLKYAVRRYPSLRYFNLDVADPETTLRNQRYIEDRGLRPIPIWHATDDRRYLDLYSHDYPLVAVGGIAGKQNREYFANLMRLLSQRYPGTDFHLLGVGLGGITAFREAPPNSVDFSTWGIPARYGRIIMKDPVLGLVERRLPREVREGLRARDKVGQEREAANDRLRATVRENIRTIMDFEREINDHASA